MVRVTLAVALVLLVACGNGTQPASTPTTPATAETSEPDEQRMVELDDRQGRWDEAQPPSYRFTVAAQCFCLETFTRPRSIIVEGGQVVAEDPAPGDDADPERVLTIEDLFDRARIAIDHADAVEIVYDNDFDFPSTIAIDDMLDAIDDEITYVVTHFEVLTG
jgi:Family of unknown function (DUF6174)